MKTFLKTVVLSSAILSGTLLVAAPSTYASSTPVYVQINDKLMSFPDSQPFIDNNYSTQVPIRFIAESLGAKVGYTASSGEITLSMNNKSIWMKIGSNQAKVNGKSITLSASPKLVNNRTYVPLRFITETFGYGVTWNKENQIAIISQDGKAHKAAAVPKLSSNLSSKIISTSKNYIGTKYLWGGTTPNGFDCSGFVDYVFNKHGIDLPHSSQAMHNTVGYPVAKSDLKPGDLVFFITNKVSTSHVGIYIGNNEFISATSSGVKIASLSNSYWGPKYNGANRIL